MIFYEISNVWINVVYSNYIFWIYYMTFYMTIKFGLTLHGRLFRDTHSSFSVTNAFSKL